MLSGFSRALAISFGVLTLSLGARAESGSGAVGALLDPDTHLTQARSGFDSGEAVEAARHLQVALELSVVGSSSWQAAYQLAMEKRPDLFAQALTSSNFATPLALVPEDESLYAPDEMFRIPPYGPQLATLDQDRRDTIRFHLKNGRPLDAAHVVENVIAEQRNHLGGLMLAAILYERFGQLALAETRWIEVAQKARGVDSQARFAALFGIFRTKYRRQDFKVAEALLDKYIKEAQAHLTEVLERYRTSSGNKDSLYWLVLEGRRHLVEGFDALGVLKSLRKNHNEALFYFEQASLLAPGSIVISLNHVQALQKLLHTGTARELHSKMAEALSALERALLAQLDRQIDEGALDLGMPLTFRDLVRNTIARIRVRQSLFERTVSETKAAHSLLVEALNLGERSPLAHYFMGLELKASDQLDEAIVRFKRVMEIAPPTRLRSEAKKRIDEVFELQALRAQWARTRNDQLKAHLEEKLDPEPLQIFRRDLADGLAMLEKAEYSKAREHFARLAEYHKDSVDVFRWLGYANQEIARFKEALVAYDKALAIDPVDPWALSQKAICMYEYVNDLPNALRLAGEAARIKGDDPHILSNLGWLHAMAGELRKGIELLSIAIEKSPKDPRHHHRLGMAYYNLGIYPFAAVKFSDVIALQPKHTKANVFLGLAHARVGKMDEAIAQLSKALENVHDDPDLTGMVTQNLALLRGGAVPKTATGPRGSSDPRLPLTREEAIRLTAAHAALARARTHVLKGELAQAKELLATAHKEFPTAIELSLAQAFVLLTTRQEADRTLAKEIVSQVLDLNTQEIRALHLFAHIRFQQGAVGEFVDGLGRYRRLPPGLPFSEFVDAIGKRWSEVLDIDRNDPSAIDAFGQVELLSGRLESAQDVLTRSTTPEGKRLLGEVLMRLFFIDHTQLTFQKAKQALTEGAYPQIDRLDLAWKQVMEPDVAPAERVAVKPGPIQPAKELEGWARISPEIKKLALDQTGRVVKIDVNNTLIGNRRWSQIDQSMRRKIERQEAAKARESAERDREAKEIQEKAEQDKIRSNVGGPERPRVVPPPVPGLPQPAGAIVVGDLDPPAPRNQLKALAANHLESGLQMVAGGKLTDAVREFKAAVTLDPRAEEPLITLGLALAIGGERTKANTVLRSRRVNLQSPVVSLLLGHIAWLDGRPEDAQRDFEQAAGRLLAVVASQPAPRKGRRKAVPKQKELAFLTISRKAWQEMLVDNPADLDANLNMALLDFFAGKASAALARLEGLSRTPEGASAYGEVALFLSHVKPNRSALKKAVEILGAVDGGAPLLERQRALSRRLASLR